MATTTTFRRWGAVLVSALLVPGALVAACSNSNDNPTPPPNVYTIPDTGTSAQSNDSGTGVQQGTDGSGGNSEDSPVAVDSAPTLKDGAPVQDAASCESDGGCWSCSPVTTPQFLNQCSSSQCSPFSNSVLPGYDGSAASLPPLN
jgi:hypothetical protein